MNWPGFRSQRRVLFLCTGNFYRSRFAEAVFNYHAAAQGLPWSAFSRGLAIHLVKGRLSVVTAGALKERGIHLKHTGRTRRALTEPDLQSAERVIALQDAEHRPMIVAQFPLWEERILFWDVADVQDLPHPKALARIEAQVLALLEELAAELDLAK